MNEQEAKGDAQERDLAYDDLTHTAKAIASGMGQSRDEPGVQIAMGPGTIPPSLPPLPRLPDPTSMSDEDLDRESKPETSRASELDARVKAEQDELKILSAILQRRNPNAAGKVGQELGQTVTEELIGRAVTGGSVAAAAGAGAARGVANGARANVPGMVVGGLVGAAMGAGEVDAEYQTARSHVGISEKRLDALLAERDAYNSWRARVEAERALRQAKAQGM